MERLCSPAKGRAVRVDLPPVKEAADVATATATVVEAMAEARSLWTKRPRSRACSKSGAKQIETQELEKRIRRLEQGTGR